ncbi:MAG TPA: glycosyltransferase family 39 protein, partial [Oligoflexia bacterium]|nr:glycosyltransferase family 39 protein [Oligoflexia bacterium]
MGNYGERSPEAPNSRGRRLLLVFALLFSLCFSHIHQGSVWTDGVRYAAIAKNIILDGQYFRLYDDYTEAPYVNKPPVLFWLIAASMKALGYSTFSVKLPGALIAFGAMLLFAAGACWLFDSRTALLAVLLFSANALFFRSVVDINFEGLILCGGILLLFALLRLSHLLHLDFITALALGLGAAFLLISKPPYLLFAAPALAYAL